MDGQSYYKILQIQPTASQEEVRAAYKQLALLYHPDLSSHPQSTLHMQALNEAFEVLGNQEKRALYDHNLLNPAPPAPVQPDPNPTSTTQPGSTIEKDQDCYAQAQKEPARRESDGQLYRWMRGQLRVFIHLMYLTMALFAWSLISGQVSAFAVVVLVLLSISIVASMVVKIKKPATRVFRRKSSL